MKTCSEFDTLRVVLRAFLCAAFCISVGCGPTNSTSKTSNVTDGDGKDSSIENAEADAETFGPDQILNVGRTRGWKVAEQIAAQTLIRSPDDVGILVASAEVKQRLGKKDEMAMLLVDATCADQFVNETLVLQAVAGLMANGQLFESIELLEDVVKNHPDRNETRRWLFDCLVNSEQISLATPHGRRLIRDRHFDSVLLFSMGQNEQRDREVESLTILSRRNPSDARLTIGMARLALDRGEFDESGKLLQKILEQHPTFSSAWCLEAERLFLAGKHEILLDWLQNVPANVKRDEWKFWATVGNVALKNDQPASAARAYWESIQRNDAVGKIHAKLARSLQLIANQHEWVDPELLEDLTLRAELLEQLVQVKDRFYRSEMKSPEIATSIANLLAQLGRNWEAEAWLANAIRESNGQAKAAVELRAKIVAKLRSDLPWQIEPDSFTKLNSHVLASLPELSIESLLGEIEPTSPAPITVAGEEAKQGASEYRLIDESESCGLVATSNDPIQLPNGVIPIYSQLGSGGASLDYDLDGWPDIFVAGSSEMIDSKKPRLSESDFFRNEAGQLRRIRLQSNLLNRGFPQGTVTGDLNADGFVDLVQLNYGVDQVFLNNGDGTFSEASSWFDQNDLAWSTSGAIADLNADGISDMIVLRYCEPDAPLRERCRRPDGAIDYCAPTHYNADIDQFFRGRPTGGLETANKHWDIRPTNPGRGLGLIVGQLDETPSIDVFVANDMTSNHFWSRSMLDNSKFAESGTLCGLALDWRSRPQASMGIAAADFDGDHDLDFYVTNFEKEHNTLYLQQNPGIWSDQTRSAGLYESSFESLGFGTIAIDLDNDTSDEVMICNGHVHHDSPSGYEQHPHLWTQIKRGFQFVPRPELSNYFQKKHVGRSVWKLDINRDSNTDLVITHQGESPKLLCNRTKEASENHSLKLRLVGTESARDAIGSVVLVTHGSQSSTRWLLAGDGYMASCDKVLSFGLGTIADDARIDVSITWPDGTTQSIQARPDRELLVVQNQTTAFVLDETSNSE
nr:CRTAC1 family protein [Rhodopirellula europaea]